MNNQILNGGPSLTPDALAIVKALQHYEAEARAGRLAGIAIVGVDPVGNVSSTPAMALNPHVMHIVIGALAVLSGRIARELDRMTVAAAPSPIIRPVPGLPP